MGRAGNYDIIAEQGSDFSLYLQYLENAGTGVPMRFAHEFDVDFGINNRGSWEETEDGYKSLKIPIIDVEVNSDHGVGLEPQPVYSVEDLVFTGMVKKAFIHKWEKRKYYPVNAPSGMESYFPIKKEIKLTLPKETEK